MDLTNVKVELIPIFEDNYVFVLVDVRAREALVVDPGESSAVEEFLRRNRLSLKGILLTHHHHDHIGGGGDVAGSVFRTGVCAVKK